RFGDMSFRAPPTLWLTVVLLASGGCGGSQTLATSAAPAVQRDSQRAAQTSPPRTGPQTSPPRTGPQTSPPRPRIVWNPIPFGPKRKAEMVAYVRRPYGSFMQPTWRLVDPHVIVIHYTDSPSFGSTYNTFAADVPDPELHELPGTCAHFVIDEAGTIHQ